MIERYVKKPIVVNALQWRGANVKEICDFIKDDGFYYHRTGQLTIRTLEGNMVASIGDYIIQGVDGEFYPCKPIIFEKTYTKV
jgi:hypothetical protein